MKPLGLHRRRPRWFGRKSDGNSHEVPTLIEVSTSTLETRDDEQDIIFLRPNDDGRKQHRITPSCKEEREGDKDEGGSKKPRKKWCWRRSGSTTTAGTNRSGSSKQPERPAITITANNNNNKGQVTILFWSSPTALSLYGLLALYVMSGGHGIFWYAIGSVVLNLYGRVAAKWLHYMGDDDDHELRRSISYLRRSYQLFWRETDRVLSGDYGRQVVAAYLLHACTAPGESYLAFWMRHKMHALNDQWMDELNRWGERRLGYEPSQCDVFA